MSLPDRARQAWIHCERSISPGARRPSASSRTEFQIARVEIEPIAVAQEQQHDVTVFLADGYE
jgi:hypothetical protein